MTSTKHVSGNFIGQDDRYCIERYLAAGGMQEVYIAKDRVLERNVALKVPFNSSAERRFARSAHVSARVNHPNAAKTLDYFDWDGSSCLVEELVDGCDLKDLLSHFEMIDPMAAAYLLHHIARGVAAMHHVQIVHRDLKPSNIMVVGGLSLSGVKITDFGIARMAQVEIDDAVSGGQDTMTASTTVVGAIPYMAPEVIEDKSKVSAAADIWSVGAIAYELLCGVKPFGDGLIAIRNVFSKKPERPDLSRRGIQFRQLTEDIFQIIEKCLVIDAGDRPSADELVGLCGDLCYPPSHREVGHIKVYRQSTYGFIHAEPDAFFNTENVFGQKPSVGQAVWFSRHEGRPNPRAFPIVPFRSA